MKYGLNFTVDPVVTPLSPYLLGYNEHTKGRGRDLHCALCVGVDCQLLPHYEYFHQLITLHIPPLAHLHILKSMAECHPVGQQVEGDLFYYPHMAYWLCSTTVNQHSISRQVDTVFLFNKYLNG